MSRMSNKAAELLRTVVLYAVIEIKKNYAFEEVRSEADAGPTGLAYHCKATSNLRGENNAKLNGR